MVVRTLDQAGYQSRSRVRVLGVTPGRSSLGPDGVDVRLTQRSRSIHVSPFSATRISKGLIPHLSERFAASQTWSASGRASGATLSPAACLVTLR